MHGATLLILTLSLWLNKVPCNFHLSVAPLVPFISQSLPFYSSFYDLASIFTSTNPEWLSSHSLNCRHRLKGSRSCYNLCAGRVYKKGLALVIWNDCLCCLLVHFTKKKYKKKKKTSSKQKDFCTSYIQFSCLVTAWEREEVFNLRSLLIQSPLSPKWDLLHLPLYGAALCIHHETSLCKM